MPFECPIITAAQVIAEARKHVGTPYRARGRGGISGFDCVGLGIRVGIDLGQVPTEIDALLPPYSTGSLPKLLDVFFQFVDEIHLDDVAPGCGYLLCHDPVRNRKPRHLAIVSDVGLIQVSMYTTVDKVSESAMDDFKRARLVKGWKFKGILL